MDDELVEAACRIVREHADQARELAAQRRGRDDDEDIERARRQAELVGESTERRRRAAPARIARDLVVVRRDPFAGGGDVVGRVTLREPEDRGDLELERMLAFVAVADPPAVPAICDRGEQPEGDGAQLAIEVCAGRPARARARGAARRDSSPSPPRSAAGPVPT
jgi:hypothetical protein